MRQSVRAAGVVVWGAATLVLSVVALQAATDKGVRAVLELNQQFYYGGDPLPVRVSIGHDGAGTVDNPVKTPLLRAIRVLDADGKPLERIDKAAGEEPTRLDKLGPDTFYGAVVELTQVYPGLARPGTYRIEWSADGIESNPLDIRILPKYDPAKEYQARVETTEGTFVIEFFPKSAPVAVKTFHDLVNAGYYDGLLVHEIQPNRWVAAGDPVQSEVPRYPLAYPQEQSAIPVVAGTVLLRPLSAAPPANGSTFMIALNSEPTWTGQATVLGQVVEGLEVVQKISRLPSSEQSTRPYFKPLKNITIRKVTVAEKKLGGA